MISYFIYYLKKFLFKFFVNVDVMFKYLNFFWVFKIYIFRVKDIKFVLKNIMDKIIIVFIDFIYLKLEFVIGKKIDLDEYMKNNEY